MNECTVCSCSVKIKVNMTSLILYESLFYSICVDLRPTRYSRCSRIAWSPRIALLSGISWLSEAWQTRRTPLSMGSNKTRVPLWSTLTLDAFFGLKAR